MNKRLTAVVVLFLLSLTGCAKYSKQEKAQALYNMQSSQRAVNGLVAKMKSSGAYSNGQCVTPPRGKKPKPYVRDEKKAEEIAGAFCLSGIGCDAYASLSGADTAWAKFAESEACGQALDLLREDGLVANNTGRNMVESVLEAGCEKEAEGFWGALRKGFSCVMDTSAKIVKVAELDSCLRNKHKQFLRASDDWYHGPSRKLKACMETKSKLEVAKEKLARDKSTYNMMVSY